MAGRSRHLALITLLLAPAWRAHAEDSVSIWANYYKERSTRVVAPMIVVNKDLPYETKVQVGYLVDQITSASGAFTPQDQAFQEYRHELRFAAEKRFGIVTPGVSLRYSTESDYKSLTYGANVVLRLFQDTTTLRAAIQGQSDSVGLREDPSFKEGLSAFFLGLSVTQVVLKNLLAGLSFERTALNGYQENVYRVEQHPRERTRYSLAGFASYHFEPSDTTARVGYRLYSDDWKLTGHAVEIELTQYLSPDFQVTPRFRVYTQNGVYFAPSAPEGFNTVDPKLFPFGSRMYGLSLSWVQSWLANGFLDPLARSRVEPSYAYLDQDNAYGGAHIVQIGWYWPF